MTAGELKWLEDVAYKREQRRGYASSRDTWRHGIISNPTYVGCVGEHAAAKYLSQRLGVRIEIDTEDRPNGDGGVDIVVFGVRIQVKTRTRDVRPPMVLLKRADEQGKLIRMKWDYCAHATWERDENPYAVNLDGYLSKKEAEDYGAYCKGRRGDWKNLEYDFRRLHPIAELVDVLKINRDLKGVG